MHSAEIFLARFPNWPAPAEPQPATDEVVSESSPETVAIQIDRIAALLRVSSLIPAEDRGILDCVCGRGDPIGRVYRGSQHEAGKLHLSAALESLADRIEGIA